MDKYSSCHLSVAHKFLSIAQTDNFSASSNSFCTEMWLLVIWSVLHREASALIRWGFVSGKTLWWWNYVKCTPVVLLVVLSAMKEAYSLTAVRNWWALISWSCKCVSYLSPLILLLLKHLNIQITTVKHHQGSLWCLTLEQSPASQRMSTTRRDSTNVSGYIIKYIHIYIQYDAECFQSFSFLYFASILSRRPVYYAIFWSIGGYVITTSKVKSFVAMTLLRKVVMGNVNVAVI